MIAETEQATSDDEDESLEGGRELTLAAYRTDAASVKEFSRRRARAEALIAAQTVTVDHFRQAAADLYERPIATAAAPALSDDFAPVDALVRRS